MTYPLNFKTKAAFLTLATSFFLSSAFGQGEVSGKVQQLKNDGAQFEAVQPFASAEMISAKAFRDLDISAESLSDAAVLLPAKARLDKMLDEKPQYISVEIPTPNAKEANAVLDLYRESIFSDDIRITDSQNPGMTLPLPEVVFYRGSVRGNTHSLAAITVADGEMTGMFSFGNETFVIGKAGQANDNTHVLYKNDALEVDADFVCNALESPDYEIPVDDFQDAPKTNNCVHVRVEVDHGLTSALGGSTAATNYVAALYNQVIVLFDNDGISVSLSEIHVWSGSSPYSGGLNQRLYQLSNNHPNSDLTQLVTNASAGGIAWLSGLCSNNYGVSVAGVYGYFNNVPSYSWDVNVATHELGHNLSSPHTHACAWNGNNTAIDGCGPAVGYSEGCSGSIPSQGGTIMSYCHLTWAGMNFNQGFGTQPKTRIQNYINSRQCLSANCGGGGEVCYDNPYTLEITFDNYPQETSWEITNSASEVVASGGNYAGQSSATEDLCLEDGCHTLTFFDSFGDGICCGYGNGSFTLYDENGNPAAAGGQFGASTELEFCTVGSSPNCDFINFHDYDISSYGGNRDIGSYTILNGGSALFLQYNALKMIPLNYTITPNTVLEFEFNSTQKTQLHGVGFDNDAAISLVRVFKVFGRANANKVINEYGTYSGPGYSQFQIPVGEHYTGSHLSNMFFLVGRTTTPGQGNAYFKNVRVYESGECTPALTSPNFTFETDDVQEGFVLFPNPSAGQFQLLASGEAEIETVRVYNASGALVSEREVHGASVQLDLSDRVPGIYLVTWTDSSGNSHREKLVISQ